MNVLVSSAIAPALRAAQASAEAWSVMFAKSRVVRRDVPLGFAPDDYELADYDAVAEYMAAYERLAAVAPATASGLRWRYHEGSVLFELRRVVNAPYDDFVERVDIASAIRLMNDYIGGHSVVVSRNRKRQVLRQAERNMYLPQPNWLALSGGTFIDVCKLEVLSYSDTRRRICWRTVHSPNRSAVHDDGSVIFERVGTDRTRITVCGLQQFTLPPFWAAIDPWLAPAVKDSLVQESYRRFFTSTLDNFEACYEGRDFRVGREPESGLSGDGATPEERLWESVSSSAAAAMSTMRELLPNRPLQAFLRSWSPTPAPSEVDEHGFRHFSGGDVSSDRGTAVPAWLNEVRAWQDEGRQVLEDDVRAYLPGGS